MVFLYGHYQSHPLYYSFQSFGLPFSSTSKVIVPLLYGMSDIVYITLVSVSYTIHASNQLFRPTRHEHIIYSRLMFRLYRLRMYNQSLTLRLLQ